MRSAPAARPSQPRRSSTARSHGLAKFERGAERNVSSLSSASSVARAGHTPHTSRAGHTPQASRTDGLQQLVEHLPRAGPAAAGWLATAAARSALARAGGYAVPAEPTMLRLNSRPVLVAVRPSSIPTACLPHMPPLRVCKPPARAALLARSPRAARPLTTSSLVVQYSMDMGGMVSTASASRSILLLVATFACGFLAGRGGDVQQHPASSARRLAQVSRQYTVCRLEAQSAGPLEALLGLDKASASDAVAKLARGLPTEADAFTPLQRRPGSKTVIQDAFVRFQHMLFQHSPPLLPLHERGARGPRDRNVSNYGGAAAPLGARPSSARPAASARRAAKGGASPQSRSAAVAARSAASKRRAAKASGFDHSPSEVGGETWSAAGAKGTPSVGGPAREISW